MFYRLFEHLLGTTTPIEKKMNRLQALVGMQVLD